MRSGEHGGQVLLVWIGDEEQRGGFVVSMRCRVGGEIEAGGGGCKEIGELRPRSAMVAARERGRRLREQWRRQGYAPVCLGIPKI